jgi:hypothetical protein
MHTTLTPAARLLSAAVAVVTTSLLFSSVISLSGPDRERLAHARQAATVQVAAATPRDAAAAPAAPAPAPTAVALAAAPAVDAR